MRAKLIDDNSATITGDSTRDGLLLLENGCLASHTLEQVGIKVDAGSTAFLLTFETGHPEPSNHSEFIGFVRVEPHLFARICEFAEDFRHVRGRPQRQWKLKVLAGLVDEWKEHDELVYVY